MAKVAIIIAFGYNAKNQKNAIPSVLMDIYMSYKQAEAICCKILIITDNTEKNINNYIEKAIIEGIISTEILELLDTIVDNIIYFSSELEMKKKIEYHSMHANNLFLYFSGHGEGSKLMFPEYTHRDLFYSEPITNIEIGLDAIINTLVSVSNRSAEIFILIDMCEANQIEMPFLYVYGDIPYYKFIGIKDVSFCKGKKVMCVCNSKAKTFSYKQGSSLTINFYSKLKMYGSHIITSLSSSDDIRVYSSHPNMLHIPTWFVSSTQTSIWTMEHLSNVSIYNNSG